MVSRIDTFKQAKTHLLLSEGLFLIWMLVLGCVLPLVIAHTSNSLPGWTSLWLEALGFIGITLLSLRLLFKIRVSILAYSFLAVIVAAADFGLASDIDWQSFGRHNYVLATAIISSIGVPLILLIAWFYLRLSHHLSSRLRKSLAR